MTTLTVHIPINELDALKYACARTDEKLYIHESIAKLRDQAVNCELAASIEFENYNDKN